ncbi:DUF4145 domain-containing protein [Infirmifilum sp. NZ]|uniref:DUF4145 domain-containing protein n=1 Tax=Infirmifilum sp. NZ TaxID=2926850 RepID=UPI0027A16B81|nr:DUF4145 domain-containing protein [Infirmifilum sp. NZ]UNQ73283.1 DUF4145 domain-containing protein [Infirmifilum sp. NZ]
MVQVPSDVISVRVRRGLREEVAKLGIDVREVIERALEEEVRRVKRERFRTLVEEALRSMDVDVEEWASAVKESRLER